MSERAAYLRDGTAIYQRSFAIIRAEADLSRFSAEEADIAVRMIHACGQVEAAQHIVFGGDIVKSAQRRDLHAQRSAHGRRRRAARHDTLGGGARSVARSPRRRRGRHR
jgi:hypothetical protein